MQTDSVDTGRDQREQRDRQADVGIPVAQGVCPQTRERWKGVKIRKICRAEPGRLHTREDDVREYLKDYDELPDALTSTTS